MLLLPTKIPLWQQVIVTPEDNKIIVFHKGNPQASKETICSGGH
tara:strand:+ start:229 stop:360 length:132 start_codon:yes stop_codon:yes gene_type:complete